ncbi:MAG: hypothetical protein JNM36_05150 [Chitinophagales bacterium]|nr:hypothetical protein [Chitinophagales bacterium]HNI44636.1 hypothetical protein [Chitinophagales bacterium]HNL07817.1 hypothetical protein [Chitinophagales bacterium]
MDTIKSFILQNKFALSVALLIYGTYCYYMYTNSIILGCDTITTERLPYTHSPTSLGVHHK